MKIAIVGSSGYIAGFLLKRICAFSSVESILKIDQTEEADAKLNLLQPEQFDYSLLHGIDYVIFTAAISGPDKCASDFEWCWSINVIGTAFFIERALEKGCKVLFFSSDAVFGDIPGQIYTEMSETKAETPYGRMKKEIEDRFQDNKSFKVIRLSYVASAQDRFVSYCLACVRENKTAEVFHPFYRNCVTVQDVVNVVAWFLENWDAYEPFVLNVAGKELVSRVRIADEINRFLGNSLHYKIVNPEASFYENRPMITQMESLYLPRYHIIQDRCFTEKIQRELEDWKG